MCDVWEDWLTPTTGGMGSEEEEEEEEEEVEEEVEDEI